MAIKEELAGSTDGQVQGDLVNGSTMVIDHNHPLYLSSSDVPGALSIGIQLTRMENYTLWSRAMEIALLGRNKVGFIDGSVLRTDFDGALKKIWDLCNAIVISWLTCNVIKDLLSGILYSSSANQVWLDLKERFDKAYALIIQDESQKGIVGSVHEGMESLALYAARNFRSPQPNSRQAFPRRNFHSLFCDFCNMKGHTRAECNKLKKSDHCNAIGHVKDDSFQLIGYPENFKGKKKVNAVMGDSTMQKLMPFMQDQLAWKAHTVVGEKSLPDLSQMGEQLTHNQLLQMLNKSSLAQLNQILNVLQGNNNTMNTQKSAHMAGLSEDGVHEPSIYFSHEGDSELTPCVVFRSAVPANVSKYVGVFPEAPVSPHVPINVSDNNNPIPQDATRRSNRPAK
ncbi:hypothetical protein KY284_010630 [Solanum tuberosum]|nr:hypothetical protein KY284_010630 [Solanum tuberosum]